MARMRHLAATIAIAALPAFHFTIKPLTPAQQNMIVASHHYYPTCPVPLSGLRVLTMTYDGWDGKAHTGQMVTNAGHVFQVAKVFKTLYKMHFPIRYMSLPAAYGPLKDQPKDEDVTYSFSCRQAVPSPCSGGSGTGSWSMHAYGEAIDVNPVENPYVGCGQTRDPISVSFMKRTPIRKGMVTPAVLAAFQSVGWGWGGSWSGSTKDYMHFSTNGH
jgi:hypothetical protein